MNDDDDDDGKHYTAAGAAGAAAQQAMIDIRTIAADVLSEWLHDCLVHQNMFCNAMFLWKASKHDTGHDTGRSCEWNSAKLTLPEYTQITENAFFTEPQLAVFSSTVAANRNDIEKIGI